MYRVVRHEKLSPSRKLAGDTAWLLVSGAALAGLSTIFWLRRVLPW